MLISASRRTDIPAFYAEWFFNRIQAGYVLVRNPMNAHQVSRIDLRPEVVDGIVFWTKNPLPMLDRLNELKDYMYYFQFTLNAYGQDVESHVPSKSRVIIPVFQKLADIVGPERVIWRYDPIFYSDKYDFAYHTHYFAKLAEHLAPYTKKCTISFLDLYRSAARNIKDLHARQLSEEEQRKLAAQLAEIADGYGLKLDTCAESIDLQQYGIEHAHCVDAELFGKLLNCPLQLAKDKNQRLECGCAESIDIGSYDTCCYGCQYCYATNSAAKAVQNFKLHDPQAPLLTGTLGAEDKVTERKMKSCRMSQTAFDFYLQYYKSFISSRSCLRKRQTWKPSQTAWCTWTDRGMRVRPSCSINLPKVKMGSR